MDYPSHHHGGRGKESGNSASSNNNNTQSSSSSSSHRRRMAAAGAAPIAASSSSSYLDRASNVNQPQHHRLAAQQSWPQHHHQQQQQQQPPLSSHPHHHGASLYAQGQSPYTASAAAAASRGGYPSISASSSSHDIMMTAAVAGAQPSRSMLDQQSEYAQHQQLLRQQQQHQRQPDMYGDMTNAAADPFLQHFAYQQQHKQQQTEMLSAVVAAAANTTSQPYHHPPHRSLDVLQHSGQVLAAGLLQQRQQQHQSSLAQQPPPPPQQQQHPYMQQRIGRITSERPLIKLSLHLIDTYKQINTVYYEERDARRATRAREKAAAAAISANAAAAETAAAAAAQTQQPPPQQQQTGTNNNGWDDEHFDYIINPGELILGRYQIKERIGKGSFGQVVRAEDMETRRDVAVKIIKSKKPFLMQAKTEIELLTHLNDQDPDDQHNVVRLLAHFMYRNHQCLVFEMLSINLYELLKNTQFAGVSLKLIRKFAKQVLKSLQFLARSDVDIIHCDLKPENILLRHPKKSSVKVIDFGSSCRSNKRMYSYIQSRFYRSPEVILGLPYAVSIDMWSLGCILAEMHTGEPLFSGSDQFDQMQKIVKLLGMVPSEMLERSSDQHRLQFFEKIRSPLNREMWYIRQSKPIPPASAGAGKSAAQAAAYAAAAASVSLKPTDPCVPSTSPISTLKEVITAENHRKKKYPTSETGNTPENYEMFVDLIYRMLAYDPKDRIRPEEALNHPFIVAGDPHQQQPPSSYHQQGTYSQRRN